MLTRSPLSISVPLSTAVGLVVGRTPGNCEATPSSLKDAGTVLGLEVRCWLAGCDGEAERDCAVEVVSDSSRDPDGVEADTVTGVGFKG